MNDMHDQRLMYKEQSIELLDIVGQRRKEIITWCTLICNSPVFTILATDFAVLIP